MDQDVGMTDDGGRMDESNAQNLEAIQILKFQNKINRPGDSFGRFLAMVQQELFSKFLTHLLPGIINKVYSIVM